jgi:hypothetical protein
MIIQENFKNLYSCKIENEEEINFLTHLRIPKVNKEAIKNLNRSVTSNEIKTVIKNLSAKKSPGPDRFNAEFYQTFKKN